MYPILTSSCLLIGNPPTTRFGVGNVWRWCRNRSENYEFFQAVSHFAHETTAHCQLTEAASKIYQLYVSETAPLRVDLDDGICQSIKKVPEAIIVCRGPLHYSAICFAKSPSTGGAKGRPYSILASSVPEVGEGIGGIKGISLTEEISLCNGVSWLVVRAHGEECFEIFGKLQDERNE